MYCFFIILHVCIIIFLNRPSKKLKTIKGCFQTIKEYVLKTPFLRIEKYFLFFNYQMYSTIFFFFFSKKNCF